MLLSLLQAYCILKQKKRMVMLSSNYYFNNYDLTS